MAWLMKQLSYSDRSLFLDTFDSLRNKWSGSDEELIQVASEWVKSLTPRYGFEFAIARDVAALSRYLLDRKNESDISEIARGGLAYVFEASNLDSDKFSSFGMLDEAFVASYAVHEIRTRLGEPASYTPPRLTETEQDQAESLFLKFVDSPVQDDNQLIANAHRVGESLGNFARSGLFRRLQKNIDFLANVLQDKGRTAEQQSFARAALAYLVSEEDAIDDRLGIVGYLDDSFVAQLAVDLIEPNREPWLELLDATVAAWPFLNNLLLDNGSCVRPLSEYMIINSALACADVRSGSDLTSTLLIVPDSGPTPFLLGVLATIGLIQNAGRADINEESFRIGQRVLVDHCAVAEFAGFDTINGRRMFKLRQYRKERGQRLASVRYWPISDLPRLLPADKSHTTRGKLTQDLTRSDAMLPGLEYLFLDNKGADLSSVTKRVVLVTPVATAHDLAKNLSLHGIPLKDVIPMGQLLIDDSVRDTTKRMKPRPWSSKFGRQEPLLMVIPDVDTACEYAEEHKDKIELVIIDYKGRNANKSASLQRLRHFRIPTLVVSPERSAEKLSPDEENTQVLEWTEDDFASLLWPPDLNENESSPVVRLERRLQTRSRTKPNIHTIAFEPAEQVFRAVRHLHSLARARGEERLNELDEIISFSYRLMSRLLRTAVVLSDSIPSASEIDTSLRELLVIRDRSRFLSENERSAIEDVERLLRRLFEKLKTENPKAEAITTLLGERPGLALLCPDKRLCDDLENAYPDSRVFFSYPEEQSDLPGVIIPGWFRKERMAALLVPPIAQPLHIVLYDIENKWYTAFDRERRAARAARAARGGRSKLFPNVDRWRERHVTPPPLAEPILDTSLQELDAIQKDVSIGYRQRIYQSARSNDAEGEVPARLVLFDGDTYAFLTESFKANVVTHLLDDGVDDPDEKPGVKQKTVSQLFPGEALLFQRGSDRDVIRSTADKILPAGRRDTSALWRKTLLEFAEREQLSAEQLHARLRGGGCPLKLQTIKFWLENDDIIAPQEYKRDVEIIAKVTKDQDLEKQMDQVLAAISEVRSAHLRAAHLLAKKVLAQAVNILRAEGESTSMIEVEDNVVIVRVAEIDVEMSLVRKSFTNRLLEGEPWLE